MLCSRIDEHITNKCATQVQLCREVARPVKINLLLLAKWQKVALGLFYADWDYATWQRL